MRIWRKIGHLALCLLVTSALVVASVPAPAQTVGKRIRAGEDDGETHLVLTYKAPIEKRIAFRKYMEGTGITQFEGWKNKGVFTGYKILFATQVNEHLPDMWVILDFAKFSDIAKWHAIQRDYPGGLAPEGIALGAPQTDTYSDLVWQGGVAKTDQSKSLYMIIPYISLVASQKYEDFVNKYVVPQLTGWVESGLMPSYAIYLNQNPTNAPWHSLLLLEYDGIRGIALRDSLKEKIRGRLANDPGYKQYSEIKTTIRKELEPATFEVVLPK